MTIANKAKTSAARRLLATTTIDGNGNDPITILQQSTVKLDNNMGAEMLIEPEEDKGGATHTSILAKAKKRIQSKVGAAAVSTNVGTLENEVTDQLLDPENEDIEQVLTNNMGAESLEVADAAEDGDGDDASEDDWDGDGEDLGDEQDLDNSDVEESEEVVEELGAEPPMEVEDQDVAGTDVQSLLDIDEVADDKAGNCVFAAYEGRLAVIRANRIIATMTERQAIKTQRQADYLSPEFQTVCAHMMQKKGIRAGLKAMGFAISTVDVAKSNVVNARVANQVKKSVLTASTNQAQKEKVMAQSLAIASVGINRSFFANVENPLRAALERELVAAGVRGASKLVSRCFAAHGVDYANSLVTLANTIGDYTQETRDTMSDALDMTNGDLEDQVLPIGADDMEDGDLDDADDVDDDYVTQDVEQTLTTAGRRVTASAAPRAAAQPAQRSTYSLKASAILDGSTPFSLY